MSDIISLDEILDVRASEQLNDVVILGHSNDRNQTANTPFTLPDGAKWSQLTELVLTLGYSTGSAHSTMIAGAYTKSEIMNALVTGESINLAYNDGTFFGCSISITGESTGTYRTLGNANSRVQSLIGRKKKYAATNLTETLQVNGGNNITVNARYEIPASALPADYLNKDGTIKKNVEVRAEIFNNSGSGVADWGETGWVWNGTSNSAYGVKATVIADTVVVQSGNTALFASSNQTGSPWGNVSVGTSAKCRVIAILAGEALTVQTA